MIGNGSLVLGRIRIGFLVGVWFLLSGGFIWGKKFIPTHLIDLDSLKAVIESHQLGPREEADAIFDLGRFYRDNNQAVESIKAFEKALLYYKSVKDTRYIMYTYRNLGVGYFQLEFWAEAAFWFEGALRLAEELEDDYYIATYLGALGIMYTELEEYEKAKKSLDKAQTYDVDDEELWNMIQTNLGVYYSRVDSIELSDHYHIEALKVKPGPITEERHAVDLMNLGMNRILLGDFESAYYYVRKGDSLLQNVPNSLYHSSANIALGEIMIHWQEWDSANFYLEQGLDYARKKNLVSDMEDGFLRYKEMALAQGDLEAALAWTDSLYEIKGRIKKLAYKSSIDKFETLYDLRRTNDQSQAEIKLLEQESQISNLRFIVLVGLIGIMALVGILLIYRYRTRRRMITQKLRHNQELKEKLEEELDFRKKELSQFATYIINKNRFLQSLRKLAESKEENAEQTVKQLSHLIRDNLSHDKDLKEIEMRVRTANEDFFLRLETQFPNLTSKELQLASLVYINFTSKEIAEIYKISVTSVEKGRYRLRKKLGIETGKSLSGFLKEL